MRKQVLSMFLLLTFSCPTIAQNPAEVEKAFYAMKDYIYSIGTVITQTTKVGNKTATIKRFVNIGSGVSSYTNVNGVTVDCIITARHVINIFLNGKIKDFYIRPSWADTIKLTEYFGVKIQVSGLILPSYILHPQSEIDLGCIVFWPHFRDSLYVKKGKVKAPKIFPYQGITFPSLGEQVWIGGYPGHVEADFENRFQYNIATFKPGYVTWKPLPETQNPDLKHIALIESNATHGNSGGPVFTLHGKIELVGILVGGYSEVDSLYFNNMGVIDTASKTPYLTKSRAGVSIIEKGENIVTLMRHVEKTISRFNMQWGPVPDSILNMIKYIKPEKNNPASLHQ